ncbi:golgin subfamily A member 6-like protein 22, partial [Schistocerca americana]|uniref:golgin subfamily A member 6-like protein 22 n=1 Tax=Schistocerca americana TaxID=7009 RepID=UPI001F4F49B8
MINGINQLLLYQQGSTTFLDYTLMENEHREAMGIQEGYDLSHNAWNMVCTPLSDRLVVFALMVNTIFVFIVTVTKKGTSIITKHRLVPSAILVVYFTILLVKGCTDVPFCRMLVGRFKQNRKSRKQLTKLRTQPLRQAILNNYMCKVNPPKTWNKKRVIREAKRKEKEIHHLVEENHYDELEDDWFQVVGDVAGEVEIEEEKVNAEKEDMYEEEEVEDTLEEKVEEEEVEEVEEGEMEYQVEEEDDDLQQEKVENTQVVDEVETEEIKEKESEKVKMEAITGDKETDEYCYLQEDINTREQNLETDEDLISLTPVKVNAPKTWNKKRVIREAKKKEKEIHHLVEENHYDELEDDWFQVVGDVAGEVEIEEEKVNAEKEDMYEEEEVEDTLEEKVEEEEVEEVEEGEMEYQVEEEDDDLQQEKVENTQVVDEVETEEIKEKESEKVKMEEITGDKETDEYCYLQEDINTREQNLETDEDLISLTPVKVNAPKTWNKKRVIREAKKKEKEIHHLVEENHYDELEDDWFQVVGDVAGEVEIEEEKVNAEKEDMYEEEEVEDTLEEKVEEEEVEEVEEGEMEYQVEEEDDDLQQEKVENTQVVDEVDTEEIKEKESEKVKMEAITGDKETDEYCYLQEDINTREQNLETDEDLISLTPVKVNAPKTWNKKRVIREAKKKEKEIHHLVEENHYDELEDDWFQVVGDVAGEVEIEEEKVNAEKEDMYEEEEVEDTLEEKVEEEEVEEVEEGEMEYQVEEEDDDLQQEKVENTQVVDEVETEEIKEKESEKVKMEAITGDKETDEYCYLQEDINTREQNLETDEDLISLTPVEVNAPKTWNKKRVIREAKKKEKEIHHLVEENHYDELEDDWFQVVGDVAGEVEIEEEKVNAEKEDMYEEEEVEDTLEEKVEEEEVEEVEEGEMEYQVEEEDDDLQQEKVENTQVVDEVETEEIKEKESEKVKMEAITGDKETDEYCYLQEDINTREQNLEIDEDLISLTPVRICQDKNCSCSTLWSSNELPNSYQQYYYENWHSSAFPEKQVFTDLAECMSSPVPTDGEDFRYYTYLESEDEEMLEKSWNECFETQESHLGQDAVEANMSTGSVTDNEG